MARAGAIGRALATAALLAGVAEAWRRRSTRSARHRPRYVPHIRSRDEETAAWLNQIGPLVRDRLSDQAAAHWREFSVIIAGGSTAIALGVVGLLFVQPIDAGARVLVCGMLLASAAGFTLAYFSIQIGALMVVGPLTFMEVMASFAIAAPQVAMPLWLGYVLRRHPHIDEVGVLLPDSMHWFGLLACFSAAASFANFYEAFRRRRAKLRAPLEVEARQLEDRVGAFVNAAFLFMIWAMLREDISWKLATGLAYMQAAILIIVMANQSRTTRRLTAAVESIPAQPA